VSGEAVTFRSGDGHCAGLFFEAEGDAFAGDDGRRPCVVLAHGFTGTVDAGLVPFAERFAAAGLHALAFDYRHFGASPGEPRQLLDIAKQHADYAAAVTYARERDGVDPERVAVWGSSYAGGHVGRRRGRRRPHRGGRLAGSGHGRRGHRAEHRALRRATPAAAADRGRAARRLGISAPRGAGPRPRGRPARLARGDDAARRRAGLQAIAGPSWRNEVAARIFLRAGLYRPGLLADRLPCPILIQVADRDTVAPTKPAYDAAWRRPAAPRSARTRSGTSTSTSARRSRRRSPTSCTSCAGTSAAAASGAARTARRTSAPCARPRSSSRGRTRPVRGV
jgi:dienelactone hydrolase